MKNQSNNSKIYISLLIAAINLLPAAALARDGQGMVATLPVNINTHLETEGGDDNASMHATTTVGMHQGDEKDRSDSKQGDDADDADNEIDIDHDSADSATTTIDAPEHVTTRGQLRSFLNHLIKEDDRISDVHVSSSTIETHYEMPAKFLWAIPTNLTADVSVASNGSVTVTYPWYSFFFTTQNSEIATQLKQSTTSDGTTTLSASAQAHLLNLLFSNLKTSTKQ